MKEIVRRIAGTVLAIEALLIAVAVGMLVQFSDSIADFDGEPSGMQPVGYVLLAVLLTALVSLSVVLWLPTKSTRERAAKAALATAVLLQVLFVVSAVWM